MKLIDEEAVVESVRWRVGRKVGRTVYCDDALVGLMDTPAIAANVVACLNAITGGHAAIRSLAAQERAGVCVAEGEVVMEPNGKLVVNGEFNRVWIPLNTTRLVGHRVRVWVEDLGDAP